MVRLMPHPARYARQLAGLCLLPCLLAAPSLMGLRPWAPPHPPHPRTLTHTLLMPPQMAPAATPTSSCWQLAGLAVPQVR